MHGIKAISLAVILTCILAGCSTWDKLDRTERGAIIGGGTGLAVGSAVGGTPGALIGGIGGGLGGGLIGNEMDDDKKRSRRRD